MIKRIKKIIADNSIIISRRIQLASAIFLLFVINLWVNSWIKLEAMVLDDLSTWTLFINRHNFIDFLLNIAANKFRPVLNLVLFVLFKLFGNQIWLFDVFNLFLNFLIATTLLYIFYKLSRNLFVSTCLCCAYIVSRFAYYSISQVLGIMEALALFLAIILAYLMWRYLNTQKINYYWASISVFTLLIFTHERYISLLFFFLIILMILGINWKNLILFIIATLPVILSLGLKLFVFNIRPLDGTGGTSILDTFNFSQFVGFVLSGIHYIFGVNSGPTYLNGISYDIVPWYLNILICVGFMCLAVIGILLIIRFTRDNKQNIMIYAKNIVCFLAFLLSTIIAASVTFRLEMRWLYVSFAGFLFLLSYVIGLLLTDIHIKKYVTTFFLLWMCMVISTELLYRNYYPNIYYWGVQSIGNQLFEVTLGNYGDDFWDRKTTIICPAATCPNKDLPSIGEVNIFFSQFSKDRKVRSNIMVVSEYSEIDPTFIYDDNVLIFRYEPETNKIIEVR